MTQTSKSILLAVGIASLVACSTGEDEGLEEGTPEAVSLFSCYSYIGSAQADFAYADPVGWYMNGGVAVYAPAGAEWFLEGLDVNAVAIDEWGSAYVHQVGTMWGIGGGGEVSAVVGENIPANPVTQVEVKFWWVRYADGAITNTACYL